MEIERVKEKILEGRPGFPRQYGPQRADHQPGIPLFPQEATRDLVTIFLLTAMMFFLSAAVTPFLGPARSPQLSELIVPDWYLLFSWGLLKVADIFPQFTIGPGTPLQTDFTAAFWGDLLSGIPVIFLLILPFIDRGREQRPAKAPVRSAFGIAFILAGAFAGRIAWIFGTAGGIGAEARPFIGEIAVSLGIVFAPLAISMYAILRTPESTARKVSTWAGILGLGGFLAFYLGLQYLGRPHALAWVLSVLWPNMNTLVLMPMFGVLTAWLGTRRPYSSYEYLLNECYQCGKCHTVCPVTKVEDDALGGLNLVYNTFKKQHDGVPLWTCLACDACSAVCPLDIQYSDYILEERAKVHAKMAADGGQKE